MQKFTIGNRVRLKSGGPLMTVVGSNQIVVGCTWFSESKLHTEVFQHEWLNLIYASDPVLFENFEPQS